MLAKERSALEPIKQQAVQRSELRFIECVCCPVSRHEFAV